MPPGLVVIALVVGKPGEEWAEARGERFDLPGALISVLSLTAIMYGFSRLPSLTGAALLFAGAIGVVAFVRWELQGASAPP